MLIKRNDRELKVVDHFKHPASVLTRDGYFTREIKMSVAFEKRSI